MTVIHLFLKIELEIEDQEDPLKLGALIERQVRKIHGVRAAEISSYARSDE